MPPQPHNRWVHRFALITAAATFPLIFMGGLVTSHGAGMSVPDWPNSWGYNMFTFPPSKWVGGILFEHTHRLAASGVGLLSIILVIIAWMTDSRRWIRMTALGILGAVCFQGIIGGLRVVLSERDLAIVHGIVAQLFFCFIATFCVLTSRFWTRRRAIASTGNFRAVRSLSLITTSVVLLQLIIGAIMRHTDAGLAIPDFPTSFGHFLPPMHIDPAFRREAIHQFGTNLGLSRVTLFQIWIHFAHRIGALLVTISTLTLASLIVQRFSRISPLIWPAWISLVLLAVQLMLGILTVLLRKPADIASAHVAIGSLLLVTACVIAVRAIGLTDAQKSPIRLDLQYAEANA
jgi:heme a synthase